MKTTIDLPNDLVRKLKLRAAHDGRKLKDLTAELLQNALAAPTKSTKRPQPVILKDKKTGLPVLQCPTTPPKGQELTPDRIAELLLEQEVEWLR